MRTAILRAASYRKRGYRRWNLPNFRHASFAAPSKNALGWFALQWTVANGIRGLNARQWRNDARAAALDLIRGTNETRSLDPLSERAVH